MERRYWRTDRIVLRAPTPEDGAENLRARRDNDDLGDWLCDRLYAPFPEAALARRQQEHSEQMPQQDQYTLMITSLTGQVMGSICITHTDPRNGVFSYGLALRPDFQRQGYGREAALIVLDYFFHELRYHKCNVEVYAYNESSRAFHEALGFDLEGARRESVYSRGRYHDLLLYGMTSQRFTDRYGVRAFQ